MIKYYLGQFNKNDCGYCGGLEEDFPWQNLSLKTASSRSNTNKNSPAKVEQSRRTLGTVGTLVCTYVALRVENGQRKNLRVGCPFAVMILSRAPTPGFAEKPLQRARRKDEAL